MKFRLLLGALLSASTSKAAVQPEYSPSVLKKLGIKLEVVAQAFREIHNIDLEKNEKLRVTPDEEGKSLRFDTLDEFSIIVPIELATAPQNKDVLVR